MFSEEGYWALRRRVAVVTRGDRGVLEVTGADRLTWLQGLLTNDVLALPIGGVSDAAYLTPQGRMITDLRVANLRDRALLDVPASLAGSLRLRLDGLLFSEDAQIADRSNTLAIVDLHGPDAEQVSIRASRELSAVASVKDAAFGVPGISYFVASADAGGVIGRLAEAGAAPTTLETLDVLRIEAGRPAFLIDMDEHTIPLEAGLESRAISFTKGCYVGQEVIVRIMHRGQGRVAKRLVGLALAQSELPKAGDPITAGTREVGKLTSVTWSPTLGHGIALGYVRREFVTPGTALHVTSVHGLHDATVVSLPFVAS